jgi:hypothetical protein
MDITNCLRIVENYLKQRERSSISIELSDDAVYQDIQLAAVVVVKWLIQNNYMYVGQVNIIKDHPNYTLYLH